MANTTPRRRLKSLIKTHIVAREKGKQHYRMADATLAEIRKIMKIGERCKVDAGDPVELVDLYADTDKVFRQHGIGRFTLERVDPVKLVIR